MEAIESQGETADHVAEIPSVPSSDETKLDSMISEEKDNSSTILADGRHVVLMGIALKLGGCVLTWNWGLAPGFWEYLIAVVSIGIGFILLGLCMAEIVSIMTFDGGYYGYARVILGPLGGYLVGCSGLIESVFAFSGYILKISKLFEIYFDISVEYERYMWILCYVGIVSINMLFQGKIFWNLIAFIAVGEIIIMLIYLFSSMPYLDFEKNALQVPANGSGFTPDPILYFNDFRLGLVFFNSFDLLTLTSSEVKDAKRAIHRSIMILIITMFILAIWLLFTVVAQSPGEKALLGPDAFFPLVFGFQHRFHISYNNALVIAAFPIFTTAIIYFYLVMKQVKAMASSNLLPRFLLHSFQYESYNFPLVASFLLCVFAFSANYFVSTVNILTTSARMAGLATCVVYLSMFYCYVIFKRRYGHMERCFTNPLGMISPIVGSCIFLFLLIIIVAFNLEYKSVTICYTIYMTVMLLYYYYLYAESRQCFSLQEQQVFFRAYIVKMHRRKKKALWQKVLEDVITLFSPIFPCLSQCIKFTRSPASRDHSKIYSSTTFRKDPAIQLMKVDIPPSQKKPPNQDTQLSVTFTSISLTTKKSTPTNFQLQLPSTTSEEVVENAEL